MIDAEAIAQAERSLAMIPGADGVNVPRQFEQYKVDRMAYENFHQEMMSLLIKRAQTRKVPIQPKLVPILNTILAHHFLVGIVAGGEASKIVVTA